MTTFWIFLRCAIFDIALIYAFYAWKVDGAEGYGNLIMFCFWFVSIVGCVVIFIPAQGKQKPRVKWIEWFNRSADLGFVLALAFFGHFTLAAFLAMGSIGLHAYRDKFDAEGLPKKEVA